MGKPPGCSGSGCGVGEESWPPGPGGLRLLPEALEAEQEPVGVASESLTVS